MKRLLTLLILLSGWAGATPTIVHHEQKLCGAATTCASTSFTATTGNTIFVLCAAAAGGNTVNLPTDAGSNTYTADQAGVHVGTRDNTYYKTNIAGFTGSITCNQTSSSFAMLIDYVEISGVQTSAFDAAISTYNNGAGTASPWATGTLTTTNANDILITWIDCNSGSFTYTVPTSFTSVDTSTCTALAKQVVSSTQSTSYNWTGTAGSDSMAAGAIGFKATSTAVVVPRRRTSVF